MSYYQDILLQMFEDKKGISIHNGSKYLDRVFREFKFDGNVINWKKHERGRVHLNLEYNEEKRNNAIIVGAIRLILKNSICLNSKIIYFNDNCFDEELLFDNFSVLDNYIKDLTENFPQRSYYTDANASWCLSLRENSMIDFAFSK